jgi:hypothetical protein
MEWFSSEVGEVFLRIFEADGDSNHIVYDEGNRIHRMRTQDEELQAQLLSILLKLSVAFDSDLCTYGPKSTVGFRPPSLQDLREAIELGPNWIGDIFIFSDRVLDPDLRRLLTNPELSLKPTTAGWYVLNYLPHRAPKG